MSLLKKLFGGKGGGSHADELYNRAKDIYERGVSRSTRPGELDSAIAFCQEARQEYRLLNPNGSRDEVFTLNLEASIHRIRGDLDGSIQCHEEGIGIIDKVEPHSELHAQFLNNLGEIYRTKYRRGDVSDFKERSKGHDGSLLIKVMKYALQSNEEYRTRHPTYSGYIFSLHTLGLICRDFGEFETAEQLLTMAAYLFNQVNQQVDAKRSFDCLNDVVNIKGQFKTYNLIKDMAFRNLDANQKEEAEQLLNQARQVAQFKK